MVQTLSLIVLLLTAAGFVVGQYSDCATNLATLERALYETENNLFELNRIFFPPSLLPTRFVKVVYTFQNEADSCRVTYIWAIGEVLFMQPPSLFKLNSLFFYFPNNELITLSLRLPSDCYLLINGTDGECSCMNDSHMLDILTQQLNIYAKFTNQVNVERSNTFARAVCAGELHDLYYSGKKIDFNTTEFRNADPHIIRDPQRIDYIIAAGAIVGPLVLIIALFIYFLIICAINWKQLKKRQQKNNSKSPTERKRNLKAENIVALALLGIYTYVYILILDIIAVNVVRTAKHEYKEELEGRIPFNLGVVYYTFAIDFLAVIFYIFYIITVLLYKCKFSKQSSSIPPSMSTIYEFSFFSLLIPPSVCIMSHFGYILLAWITAPSRSTTTLILYYFLFFYLFLTIRKSYKLLQSHANYKASPSGTTDIDVPPTAGPTDVGVPPSGPTDIDAPPSVLTGISTPPGGPTGTSTGAPSSAQANNNPLGMKDASTNDFINITAFFISFILGIGYVGIAALFIMLVYVTPLASEDLFSYLFNVIQFMIVVVSTQFAYKLFVGRKFKIKHILKKAMSSLMSGQENLNDAELSQKAGNHLAELHFFNMKFKEATKNNQAADDI